MVSFMSNVGKKLKEIRRKNNITQEELAEILNTNRIRISKIENDKMDMTFNEAIIICEKFHVSADSFFESNNLSSTDYISISRRYIKNKEISYTERREVLRKIHIEFENEYFDNMPIINVLERNKNTINKGKSSKIDIKKAIKK